MTSGSLNSKDKNNLIMAAVLVSMVAMAVIFFKLSGCCHYSIWLLA